MSRSISDLEVLTLTFWDLSSSYHGRLRREVTAATALAGCRVALANLGPQRRIKVRFAILQDKIIMGGKRKKTKARPTPSNIRQLRPSA